uniref:KIB1-4 beta-propeller domain-containing protein n=1 Tax=Ananas comosus var. bracteatus TaxID=296719 RepID=A0A6V7PKZ3_ANACO|nr:unnamed protein product [Ananas comosus var. bracteatus]
MASFPFLSFIFIFLALILLHQRPSASIPPPQPPLRSLLCLFNPSSASSISLYASSSNRLFRHFVFFLSALPPAPLSLSPSNPAANPSEDRAAECFFVIHLAGDADSCITELEVSWVGQKIAPFSLCRYLIVCGGELLLVWFIPSKMMLHLGIEAFQLDRSEPWRWVKMESLGDRALFIGENYRTLGFSCDSPKKWGGESNCIYYAGSGNQPWSVLRLGDAAIDLSNPELRLIKDGSPLLRTPKWFYPKLLGYGSQLGQKCLRLQELDRDRKKTKNIKELSGTVKEILGTCVSFGCTVDCPDARYQEQGNYSKRGGTTTERGGVIVFLGLRQLRNCQGSNAFKEL